MKDQQSYLLVSVTYATYSSGNWEHNPKNDKTFHVKLYDRFRDKE